MPIATLAPTTSSLSPTPIVRRSLPWRAAGWTERRAAAHLLSRFTFGARPGEVDRVLDLGLDRWLASQLAAEEPEAILDRRGRTLPALALTGPEIVARYPRKGQRAKAAGATESPRELVRQLVGWKLWRVQLAENQLAEVLAEFWFNHFNVSATDNAARPHLLSFERDAIRPRVLGRFRSLLGAVARHPAMLLYLDNARSTAAAGAPTLVPDRFGRRAEMKTKRPRGLNENFGRELMELHTLGVDGGYTQQDVIEVARAFTGWTVGPPGLAGAGEFRFRPGAHDSGPKTVLGQSLARGRGIEDGEQVLDLLAVHPKTAAHIAGKLAVRFVGDRPGPDLVARLARTFLGSGGDLRATVADLSIAPEFWDGEAQGAKIKSPLELAASALRGLDAVLLEPVGLGREIARMGQKLYAYEAPTGYPDRAEAWVNSGSLLARMSFGLELAANSISGVEVDLGRMFSAREPASASAALEAATERLMPERDGEAIRRRLTPWLGAPDLAARLRSEAPPIPAPPLDEEGEPLIETAPGQASGTSTKSPAAASLVQVVGLVLGSPEFQRR
ncbi:MAG: DUF1800 domain-containing protein [Acidobacteriota bacterium]